MTRVILADDSFVFREGLRELLATRTAVEVIDTCDSLDALLVAVDAKRPDVVITDIRMPPTNSDEGIQAAARLRVSHPQIGVVVLSQYSHAGYALALLESGSDGRAYLLKERVHEIAGLTSAIDAVRQGGSVIDPKIVEVLVEARSRADSGPLGELSDRERSVLAKIAQGKSNVAIARELEFSQRAVEKHTHAIFTKLELGNAADVSKRVTAALLFLAEEE